ncbi:MAG: MATE family efflux transporter [Erysipelotrichaceae bacterium]|nr:MATE family efflux transporter [Erysipelotrichaceae bacterium]
MAEKSNRIGQDFTTLELIKFTLPAFLMNVFTQVFRSLDDALFISRFVGEKALAAINLVNPVVCIQLGLGHLFSLGSANISARLMGEGKQKDAKLVFTKIIIAALVVGSVFSLVVNIFGKQILFALGADEELLSYGIWQIRLVLAITPIALMNAVFSTYFATAGKPKMGMICSIINGITNVLLDLLLVAKLGLGVKGAAIATVLGELFIFIVGLIFFINPKSEIHFIKPEGEYINTCLESFKYALPQFVNSLSISVTTLLTNNALLNLLGSDGVAANAIITDIRSIITAGLVGIAASISPIISYNYGNKNPKRLKKILSSTLKIWACVSIMMMVAGFILRTPLIKVFMNDNSSEMFYNLAFFGLTIEIFSVPFTSGCITISRMFIALANTKTSTIISIFRNLIIKIVALLSLPTLFKQTGIWLVVPVGEALSFVLGLYFVYINRNNYGYGKSGQAKLIDSI